MRKWQKLKSKVDYQNPYFKRTKNLVKNPVGQLMDYYFFCKPDFSIVIPIIDDSFLLVDQYRNPIERNSLEFPMGGGEKSENPLMIAKRELLEETGHRAKKFQKLGRVAAAPGHSIQWSTVYLATGLNKIVKPCLDPAEIGLKTKIIKINDFEKMIKSGQVIDGPTLWAYTYYLLHFTQKVNLNIL